MPVHPSARTLIVSSFRHPAGKEDPFCGTRNQALRSAAIKAASRLQQSRAGRLHPQRACWRLRQIVKVENRMKERGTPSSAPANREELKVFISSRESKCDQCGKAMPQGSWITLVPEDGARCMACADLDELVFLPSGNAALTRRARAHSVLSPVVLKWSRARKRYERQGLLVGEAALTEAESECLADAEARELRRQREAVRREGLDEQYVAQFAAQIRALYPGCAPGRETLIAEHACLRHSNRVGRSASAKELHDEAVHLAVHAHIRHAETNYDELLGHGYPRDLARRQVQAAVDRIATHWKQLRPEPSVGQPG
jgi:hypothetical protein